VVGAGGLTGTLAGPGLFFGVHSGGGEETHVLARGGGGGWWFCDVCEKAVKLWML